ncbi:hypothetical protein HG263_17410 [Pseudoalteromonas sp. JBTF-M23]|uniref:Uncharacterized protein n=1 Tax=Pseudoalteromonas caenipelagi TaxID=2726988 RepID=A0A849VHL7_9GAMM|nr:hypothetical protein [Pseudoalteromonas caenipelagi]NOU52310.1 hypothetical protein [Pseudoalteromonas caenipelagi]
MKYQGVCMRFRELVCFFTCVFSCISIADSSVEVEVLKHYGKMRSIKNARFIDLDGNGNKEIIFVNGSWAISVAELMSAQEQSDYNIISSKVLPQDENVESFEMFYDEASDNYFAFVISTNHEVHVFNVTADKYVTKIENAVASNVRFKDIDNDGNIEVVLQDSNTVTLVDPKNYNIKNSFPLDGTDVHFLVGNFTGKYKSELLLANGKLLAFKDNELKEIGELSLNSHFFFAKDIDKDGFDDAVSSQCAVNIKTKSVIWPAGKELQDCVEGTKNITPLTSSPSYYNNELNNAKYFYYLGRPSTSFHVAYMSINLFTGDSAHVMNTFTGGYYPEDPNIPNTLIGVVDLYGKNEEQLVSTTTKTAGWSLTELNIGEKTLFAQNGGVSISQANNKLNVIELDAHMSIFSIGYSSSLYASSAYLANVDIETNEVQWKSDSIIGNALGSYFSDWGGIAVETGMPGHIFYTVTSYYESFTAFWGLDGKPESLASISGEFKVLGDIDGDGKTEYATLGTEQSNKVKNIIIKNITDSEIDFDVTLKTPVTKGISECLLCSDLRAVDFNQDGVKELVLTLDGMTTIYDLLSGENSSFDSTNYELFNELNMQGMTFLSALDKNNQLIVLNQKGNPVKALNICDSRIIELEQLVDNKVHFLCLDTFGVFDIKTDTLVWSKEIQGYARSSKIELIESDVYWLIETVIDNILFKISGTPTGSVEQYNHEMALYSNTSAELKLLDGLQDKGYLFYVSQGPKNGKVTFTNRKLGELIYKADSEKDGNDSFTVLATKNGVTKLVFNISVLVREPLRIISEEFSTHWSDTLTSELVTSGVNPKEVTYSLVQAPMMGHFKFIDERSSEFVYIPSGNSIGKDVVEVAVVDSQGTMFKKRVDIVRTNTPPVGVDLERTISSAGLVSITLEAKDEDTDLLTFEWIEKPKHIDIALNKETGTMTFYVPSNKLFTEQLQYSVFDGVEYSAPNTITLNIDTQIQVEKAASNNTKKSSGSLSYIMLLLLCYSVWNVRVLKNKKNL